MAVGALCLLLFVPTQAWDLMSSGVRAWHVYQHFYPCSVFPDPFSLLHPLQCLMQPSQGGQGQITRWLSNSKEWGMQESVVWIYSLMLCQVIILWGCEMLSGGLKSSICQLWRVSAVGIASVLWLGWAERFFFCHQEGSEFCKDFGILLWLPNNTSNELDCMCKLEHLWRLLISSFSHVLWLAGT